MLLADTPLEASRVLEVVGADFDHPHFFILIILFLTFPGAMGKLHWKGEPYRFSGYRDPLLNKEILLILYKDLLKS